MQSQEITLWKARIDVFERELALCISKKDSNNISLPLPKDENRHSSTSYLLEKSNRIAGG